MNEESENLVEVESERKSQEFNDRKEEDEDIDEKVSYESASKSPVSDDDMTENAEGMEEEMLEEGGEEGEDEMVEEGGEDEQEEAEEDMTE